MVAFQYTKKDTKHLCGYTENVLLFTQWIKYSQQSWKSDKNIWKTFTLKRM